MKVNIWVKREDLLRGDITQYRYGVKNKDYKEWISISITEDEFVRLEDNRNEEEVYSQYEKDYNDENLFKDEEAMIYERNPDTDEIRSRRINNPKIYNRENNNAWLIEQYNRNRDVKDHVDNVDDIPRDYDNKFNKKIKEARDVIDELQDFMKVTGGEFKEWFDNLSDRAKDIYKNEYKKKK